jgi:antitoxin VapB
MTLDLPAETEQLVQLIANKTGKTVDDVVKEAIEARALAAGVKVAPPRRTYNEARVREIIARVSALPILDDRTPDDIIGYDEFGVPE